MKIASVCWIPLTQGEWTQVDLVDASQVFQFKWHPRSKKGQRIRYAVRHVVLPDGRRRNQGLHTLIMGPSPGKLVDHESRDGLDNRRANLRFANKSQNSANSAKQKGCTSQYKGVTWHEGGSYWVAELWYRGKKKYLGHFDTEEAAARAYDAEAKETHREFARLNFPA